MISIPNPCSEDFSKMSPTEKGAFCKVCSTDTWDFRQLSNGEIYQIMEDHKGKHICGRFTKSQMDDLNMPAYFAWKNQTGRTFQSKFLLACLLVFGLGLFSCENQEDASEIDNIQVEQLINDITPQTAFLNGNLEIEVAEIDLLDFVEEPPILQDIEIQGEIIGHYDYAYPDTMVYVDHDDYVLGGAVVMTDYDIIEPIQVKIEVEDSTDNSILADPIYNDSRAFEAMAYPNPTQDMTTVAIDVETEGQFQIVMFNMNGQLVTSIHNGHLMEGRQTFEVDMYDMNSGMYIIKVISNGQDETLKVQKLN